MLIHLSIMLARSAIDKSDCRTTVAITRYDTELNCFTVA